MSGNPDGFLSSPGRFRAGAAHPPVYGWSFSKWILGCDVWATELNVGCGRHEVGRQSDAKMRGNPDGFLSSPGRFAPGLLSFRYTVGAFQSGYSVQRLGD